MALQGLSARWDRLRGGPGSRRRRGWLALEVLVVALVGGWLGVLAGGQAFEPVGPLETKFSITPSLRGGSEVDIPPLGQLDVDTHDGPLHLTAEVVRINAADARRIFADPAAVNGLGERVTADLRAGVKAVVIRSTIAAVVGALLLGIMVFRRRWRPIIAAGGVTFGLVAAGAGVAAATWTPKAINQPQYQGLLASAPTVVGDARSIVTDFQKYEAQLAKLVTNVSRLYDVTSALPAYSADSSTIRVLSVSDLHINPAAWEVIRSVAEQFKVQVIVDSGDISDHGTAAENAYLDAIATLGVPYVWARGNHDSMITQAGVAAQPNGVVLDGDVVEVAGLRFVGKGDPRFTPDKDTREGEGLSSVGQMGLSIASAARASAVAGAPVDIAVFHDGAAAAEVDGTVSLILSGHYHRRTQERLPRGTIQFEQGSTGGSGLRALETEKPTPVRLSVLYFDRETRQLQAWDDITLGGLGLASAKIERRVLEEQLPTPTPSPSPAVDAEQGESESQGSGADVLPGPRGVPYAFRVPDG